MAVVYWIRAPHHTDIFTEGYVGVTTQTVEKRYRKHVKDANRGSDLTVHKAIRKYGSDLVCTPILEAGEQYCYEIEGKLRPSPNIGYNIAVGGDVSCTTGRKHKEESKRKMARVGAEHHAYGKKQSPEHISKRVEKLTGEGNPMFGKKLSDEHKAKISASSKGHKKPTESIEKYRAATTGVNSNNWGKFGYLCGHCNVELWCDAVAIYEAFHSVAKQPGSFKLSKLLNEKYKASSLENICQKLKSGWNPLEDSQWLEFYHKNTLKVVVNG